MRAFKAVVYPLAGMMQFYLATTVHRFAAVYVLLGIVLIGMGILNLRRLTSASDTEGEKQP